MASRTTKLQAVNQVISNIGQAPATNLNTTNPQVSLAEDLIDQVSIDVQSEGWVFNTEQDYPFTPDNTTNQIAIPSNILQVDMPWGSGYNVVIRDGKLYDRLEHTFTWTEQGKLDVTWLFDFEDLPEAAKQYITIRAANLFAMRMTGSTEVAKYSEREEVNARAALLEYECNQGDYSVFSSGSDVSPVRTYQPINTIWRY